MIPDTDAQAASGSDSPVSGADNKNEENIDTMHGVDHLPESGKIIEKSVGEGFTPAPVSSCQPADDNERIAGQLLLKTEQLLYFRLTFALAGLGVSLLVGYFARGQFNWVAIIISILFVAVVSLAGLKLVTSGRLHSDTALLCLNSALVSTDIVSLSLLIHWTHGIDSDLYFLFLLPILLASHTFGRRGIYLTATFASLSYVGLLLVENADLLPYVLQPGHGLTGAYAERIWVRITSRSAMLVTVSYIWGAFCQHMSQVTEHGANQLREQLSANRKLVAESRAQAAREHLINTISSAVRSTLDLDQILQTTALQLSSALSASRCAIVCQPSAGEAPAIWETIHPEHQGHKHREFGMSFCRLVLEKRSTYEESSETGTVRKTFVFDEPTKDPLFQDVCEDLKRLGLRSLVVQPIMYGSESKGVLLIAECEKKRSWTAPDLDLVKSVAGQVAIAIEHARLVDQLSRKNKDLLRKNLELDAKNLEIRTTQSQLIHQEKMASLGRMVAGIAHELNNPVNFVHGNLPYLREYFDDLKELVEAAEQLPPESRAAIDELKKKLKYDFLTTDLDNILADLAEGADRIRQIIKNLRSFSRLDEAELKEASIQEGIESSLKILNQYYGRDKIPVELCLADLPPVVCYPGQLNQVWVNLLSNAAEAANSVEAPRVRVETSLDDQWVHVSVSDNGPGIKSAFQSKIFEPFFTTKPVGQGTGLGLSICHSIIEWHGGKISFQSEPGQGTVFKVSIPLRAQPREPLSIAGDGD